MESRVIRSEPEASSSAARCYEALVACIAELDPSTPEASREAIFRIVRGVLPVVGLEIRRAGEGAPRPVGYQPAAGADRLGGTGHPDTRPGTHHLRVSLLRRGWLEAELPGDHDPSREELDLLQAVARLLALLESDPSVETELPSAEAAALEERLRDIGLSLDLAEVVELMADLAHLATRRPAVLWMTDGERGALSPVPAARRRGWARRASADPMIAAVRMPKTRRAPPRR